jgi:DNA-binding transcriptional ArsR family regulator
MPETQVNLMFRAFSDRTRLRILHLLLDPAGAGE